MDSGARREAGIIDTAFAHVAEGLTARNVMAMGITLFTLVVILSLGLAAIFSGIKDGAAQSILNAVLPLLSAWVGSILAFYFSRENYETTRRGWNASPTPPLSAEPLPPAVGIDQWLIRPDAMFFEKIDPAHPESVGLVDLLTRLERSGKGKRVPLLDPLMVPVGVLHRGVVERFLTQKAIEGEADLRRLTLRDLKNDAKLGPELDGNFGTVSPATSLVQARDALRRDPACRDLFVTARGTALEPILGWVTDDLVAKAALPRGLTPT